MAKKKKNRRAFVGAPPGSLAYSGIRIEEPINIGVCNYSSDVYEFINFKNWPDASKYCKDEIKSWIDVDGIHSKEIQKVLVKEIGLTTLQLEDVLNVQHPAKYEESESFVLLILPFLKWTENRELEFFNSILILNTKYIISLRDSKDDIFPAIRQRIASKSFRINNSGLDYTFYALIDLHIDLYHEIGEEIEEEILDLEERISENPHESQLKRIQNLRKSIFFFKKKVLPLRDIIRQVRNPDGEWNNPELKPFYDDLESHLNDVLASINLQIDLISNLFDIYISSLTINANEVMKTLTIVGAIFIPLTFVVGVYGMNFKNMPELETEHGYFITMFIMLFIVLGMLYFMRKKKWI